ncbi:Internal alternative NAD(P)H-ubiquinone oxidoreductase A1, mitochondrial, partial [Datura stramonium]|nr:Internal alternative NAD(P)H-ubiquinone oxidoreductase A1, mitochondrial [Datura stramonium]
IGIDEWLRVPSVQDVFSIGDCSGFLESTGRQVLPALAQALEVAFPLVYLSSYVAQCIILLGEVEKIHGTCCLITSYVIRVAYCCWMPVVDDEYSVMVAERQGKYLAGLLNRLGKEGRGRANSAKDTDLGDPFVYKHLGSMATVGRYKALVDLRESKEGKGLSLAGFTSWLIWRSAYLTRVVSWRNRFYVAINWLTTFIFGRDISRI